MVKKVNLEDCRRAILFQALTKKWSNKDKFLLYNKLPEEYSELRTAILSGNPFEAACEFVDVMYIAMQLIENMPGSKDIDYNHVFDHVLTENYKNKKKTQNEKGEDVRR